ncbi:MAG TPA: galactokinase family protein [Atopobiaceae bacterium]|nr:galactokinase family protein [Atopobiaceae bacterium]
MSRALLAAGFAETFGNAPERAVYACAPGRTELAGNHTDHEGGHVIAAAVDRSVELVCERTEGCEAQVVSKGYDPFTIRLDTLEPQAAERATTASLVRGACHVAAQQGGTVGGFKAYITSSVAVGSGLSSSAAFELAVTSALSVLFDAEELPALDRARAAQAIEHDYFGKPCGLMDQAASALGSIQHMDFSRSDRPHAELLDFDFSEAGYAICLVHVGTSHADLVDAYAAIPREMQQVARVLGASRLGELAPETIISHAAEIRRATSDRALLRALHYVREERLVAERAEALRARDMAAFLELTRFSGASSAMYLQNISPSVEEQSAMIALALAEEFLGADGACRIHGGGFGGTIQAFVPLMRVEDFSRAMDAVFGASSCEAYSIEHEGAYAQWM